MAEKNDTRKRPWPRASGVQQADPVGASDPGDALFVSSLVELRARMREEGRVLAERPWDAGLSRAEVAAIQARLARFIEEIQP